MRMLQLCMSCQEAADPADKIHEKNGPCRPEKEVGGNGNE